MKMKMKKGRRVDNQTWVNMVLEISSDGGKHCRQKDMSCAGGHCRHLLCTQERYTEVRQYPRTKFRLACGAIRDAL